MKIPRIHVGPVGCGSLRELPPASQSFELQCLCRHHGINVLCSSRVREVHAHPCWVLQQGQSSVGVQVRPTCQENGMC